MFNSQRGVALIIAFLTMTVMLAVTLGLSTTLFNKIKILSSMGDAVSSLYAAESGIEKTLYLDRKVIPGKGNKKSSRGLCDICNSCTDCEACTATPTSANGCNVDSCNNCEVRYSFIFDDKSYIVTAKVTPSSFFTCNAKGVYKDTTRILDVRAESISSEPIEQ